MSSRFSKPKEPEQFPAFKTTEAANTAAPEFAKRVLARMSDMIAD
jgi:hypothetical protein